MADRPPASLRAYLKALYADAPPGSLIELRWRVANEPLARRFLAASQLDRISAVIVQLAAHGEVFIGVLARARRSGTRTDVQPLGAVLWADCDTARSIAALARFRLPPSVVVASSRHRRHAYWLLCQPVSLARIEQLNRRLARTLHADPHCVDAARILRPPGSLNRKQQLAQPVELLSIDPQRRSPAAEIELATEAAEPASDPLRDPTLRRVGRRSHAFREDPLLQLAPASYVEALSGRVPNKAGKLACPFHEDRDPSLHVYPEPARGWYCFGCGRGGSIYDFASLLWGIPSRGEGFIELRMRLSNLLLGPDETTAS